MNLSLGSNEAVVKSWDYAKTKGIIFTKGTSNLTVTNKRVIATTESKRGISRDEVSISEISGISANYYSNFSILLVLLGILFFCTIILIPLGSLLFDLGTGTSLTVVVDGYPMTDAIIASSSIKRKRKKRFKLKVNKSAAKEICEQLSTIIFVELKK